MRIHELKSWIDPFAARWRGDKNYEIRRNDRNFAIDDMLVEREFDHESAAYTGRLIVSIVSYMTPGGAWGLPPEICVLSVVEIARRHGATDSPTRDREVIR